RGRVLLSVGFTVIAGALLPGCADRPAASPTPQKEIRSSSDRFFDKMKQEERERGKGPEAPAR
ncbi:MAG: hypothetical protein ACRERD_30755, partial [Candidatus Binatia bacterium]